ncbi:MAG: hypothetical protein BM556_15720 [Bacteriovorax sp. MedPE-SWde]|nr:MAG: hypothetical protein BM556_15720 [Bacteriovorax sp. MedPE-SWde]
MENKYITLVSLTLFSFSSYATSKAKSGFLWKALSSENSTMLYFVSGAVFIVIFLVAKGSEKKNKASIKHARRSRFPIKKVKGKGAKRKEIEL